MIITIGGRAGSGKSTVAKLLAKRLNLKVYSMGDLTRRIAEERRISLIELNRLQERDPSIDTEIDNLQRELGRKENDFVIDSRLGILFIPMEDFKVFLDANEIVRAKRILNDARTLERSTELNDTVAKLREREESEIKRYRQYYSFNCYDKDKYDIVINTSILLPEEVVELIVKKIENENKKE